MPLRRFAGVGLLVDRLLAHETHKAADALLVPLMTLIAQVPGHLPHTEERGLKELFIDLAHEREVQRCLALGPLVERRPRDRQQPALLADRQVGVSGLDHLPPHVSIHGLRFRDKNRWTLPNSRSWRAVP